MTSHYNPSPLVSHHPGLTAKQFIEPGSTQDSGVSPAPSKLSLLQTELAKLLDTQADYVDIFTVRDVPNTGPPHTRSHQVDVRYVAHGSPHYQAVRMDGLVYANIEDVSTREATLWLMLLASQYLSLLYKCASLD